MRAATRAPDASPTPSADPVTRAPRRGSAWLTTAVLGAGVALVVAAHEVGRWLQARGHRMLVNAPPLTGTVDPHASPSALAAVAVGGAGVAAAVSTARRLPWRALLLAAFLGALAWSSSLAIWEGTAGFTKASASAVDYLRAVPSLGSSPGAFLQGFVANIASFPSHVRAHPPGLVLLLWGMDRAGLGGVGWEAVLEHLSAAAAIPAALVALRELAGEDRARSAAPFLVFAPFAVFLSSGDAVFLGVTAWGVTALILATCRNGRTLLLALTGGACLGLALTMSYGAALVIPIPIAVALTRRRFRPLAIAGLACLVPVVALAWAGFPWIDAIRATHQQYGLSAARLRPYGYFLWADLAALAVALGPAAWVGLARLRDRRIWLLCGAALCAVVVADLSGLSKAEVERIWLPFMPWLMVATGAAFASDRERQAWLAVQVGWAILIQWLVRSPW